MGTFITFEGIDGCGKSTQASLLAAHFKAAGRRVLHTFEPGATQLGKEIREIFLKGGKGDLDPVTETLLMAADRAHHVRSVIRPALAKGITVVCERFTDSMEAYQGYGDKVPLDVVQSVNNIAADGLQPDVTILLDFPPEAALRRRGRDPDRIEARGLRFHEDVRNGFLAIGRRYPDRIALVDASEPADRVHERILRLLAERGKVEVFSPAGGTEG